MGSWFGRFRQAVGRWGCSDLEVRLQVALEELATARRMAERLRAENEQIEQQARAKNLFLANLSHELRTPLNAVIGFAELLGSGAVGAHSPKQRQYLEHIEKSGRHLLQLINDVLELSKVEAGRFEFFPEPVDVAKLIADLVDVLHTRLVRSSLVVAVQVDPALAEISIDPARLKQALMNYLSHAVNVSPARGRISVRAMPEGPNRFRLEVEAFCGGIASDEPRVFAEFSAVKGSAAQPPESAGLSLALTRRLVEAQGGEVGVRSAPGAGTTFFIVMDRVHAAHQPAAAASAPQVPGPHAAPH